MVKPILKLAEHGTRKLYIHKSLVIKNISINFSSLDRHNHNKKKRIAKMRNLENFKPLSCITGSVHGTYLIKREGAT